MEKKDLLLHICCASCGVYVITRLKDYFNLKLYYTNSCIYPKDEFDKRLIDVKKIAAKYDLKLYVDEYDYNSWLDEIKGYENDLEGGNRCSFCISYRLKRTIKKAKELNINEFGSTLSISPHKNSEIINKIGKVLAIQNKIDFLVSDFKKNDGFNKSVKLSKDFGLYRQNYCGCKFSKKEK
ncbi:MAG: epoxyqueuosine reductase QueH [Candidatus Woesearchaeota archaeon]